MSITTHKTFFKMFAFDFENFLIFLSHLLDSREKSSLYFFPVTFSMTLVDAAPLNSQVKNGSSASSHLFFSGEMETKTYVYPKRYKNLPKREKKEEKNPLNFLSFFLLFVCSCFRNDVRSRGEN